MEDETKRTEDQTPRTKWFWIITGAYLLAAIGWMIYTGTRPGAVALNLTELADLLAGLFSPLAFLWLLYAALAQRAELKLQREELRQNNETQAAQRQEMERQANAMDANAANLRADADGKYQPIFLLHSHSLHGGSVHLDIENVGAAVLDASTAPVPITRYVTARGGNGTLAHWESRLPRRRRKPVG